MTLRRFIAMSMGGLCVLICVVRPVNPQWWNPFAPQDYEECAEQSAREAKSSQALAILLSSCDSKFPGRRKPGGQGYTYYDPRQGRSFDITGPVPTKSELEYMDRQYNLYLLRQGEEQKQLEAEEKARREAEAEAQRQLQARHRAEEEARQRAEIEYEQRKKAVRRLLVLNPK